MLSPFATCSIQVLAATWVWQMEIRTSTAGRGAPWREANSSQHSCARLFSIWTHRTRHEVSPDAPSLKCRHCTPRSRPLQENSASICCWHQPGWVLLWWAIVCPMEASCLVEVWVHACPALPWDRCFSQHSRFHKEGPSRMLQIPFWWWGQAASEDWLHHQDLHAPRGWLCRHIACGCQFQTEQIAPWRVPGPRWHSLHAAFVPRTCAAQSDTYLHCCHNRQAWEAGPACASWGKHAASPIQTAVAAYLSTVQPHDVGLLEELLKACWSVVWVLSSWVALAPVTSISIPGGRRPIVRTLTRRFASPPVDRQTLPVRSRTLYVTPPT